MGVVTSLHSPEHFYSMTGSLDRRRLLATTPPPKSNSRNPIQCSVLQCCIWVCFFGGFVPNNNNDPTGMTSSVNLWPPSAEINPSLWWQPNPYFPVKSSAVLMGGGIRPAAVTLRSLVRKLKVAHAFGCNTAEVEMRGSNINQGSSVNHCWGDHQGALLSVCPPPPTMRHYFTVSCTSTAMPFLLSRASTEGSICSTCPPVPRTRISAEKTRKQGKRIRICFFIHINHT